MIKYCINIGGFYFLGKSIKELTLQDDDKILLELCDEKYLNLLNKFKYKTLIGIIYIHI